MSVCARGCCARTAAGPATAVAPAPTPGRARCGDGEDGCALPAGAKLSYCMIVRDLSRRSEVARCAAGAGGGAGARGRRRRGAFAGRFSNHTGWLGPKSARCSGVSSKLASTRASSAAANTGSSRASADRYASADAADAAESRAPPCSKIRGSARRGGARDSGAGARSVLKRVPPVVPPTARALPEDDALLVTAADEEGGAREETEGVSPCPAPAADDRWCGPPAGEDAGGGMGYMGIVETAQKQSRSLSRRQMLWALDLRQGL